MYRTLRLLLILIVPALALGLPLGMMLGNFATGDTVATQFAGSFLPDQGTNRLGAVNADRVQPASVAFAQRQRYASSASYWVD